MRNAIRGIRSGLVAVAMVAVGFLGPSNASGAMIRECTWFAVTVRGCSYANGDLLGCDVYVDHYVMRCTYSYPGSGGGGGDGGGGGGGGGGPRDSNGNKHVDNWKQIVVTTDPCAYQLDEGDKLGSNYGGGKQQRPGHKGVDIQCNYRDAVYSIGSGTVTYVGGVRQDNGNNPGIFVIVRHSDGTEAQYFHLDQYVVRVGDHVSAGQLLGRADSTGHSTGNHLHIMVKDHSGGTPVDPLDYADVGPTPAEQNGGC